MESATVASDKGSTTLLVRGNDTQIMYYGYSKTDGSYHNARNAKGGTPLPPPTPRARKGERKRNPSYEMAHVNGKKVGGNANISKFTAYVSPYFVVSNGGAYTKHIYAASQRIASKLGNEDGFGADPRRVEQAGGLKISDSQKDNIGARYKELGFTYSAPEKEKVEKDSTMDSEEEEKLIFFYHPDHLGSTSYVTDADGNIAQHIEYIPYGEVFVEERNSQFSTNFLFNAKELDNETGLYYYGARYLDPTGAMWLSVDPLYEKNISATPYNYCLNNPVVMVDPDGRETENLVKNRRDPNAVRTPGKGYNCADDFYSAKDGGCPYAVTKLYYEKWSIDYRSKLDDYRVKSKANDNIYHAFRAMAPQQERFFVNQEMIFTNNSFKEDLNVNELMEYMQNPNVDLIATFDIGDQWTAVNTLPYHTMLVDAIEVEYYSENRRKAGQVKNISFICYDTSTEKHFQNNDAKREKMNWNQLKALMKVEVDPVKLEMRNNIRKKNEEE